MMVQGLLSTVLMKYYGGAKQVLWQKMRSFSACLKMLLENFCLLTGLWKLNPSSSSLRVLRTVNKDVLIGNISKTTCYSH